MGIDAVAVRVTRAGGEVTASAVGDALLLIEVPGAGDEEVLPAAAAIAAAAVRRDAIPIRTITLDEFQAGRAGFVVGYEDGDAGFPWGEFLELVRAAARRRRPGAGFWRRTTPRDGRLPIGRTTAVAAGAAAVVTASVFAATQLDGGDGDTAPAASACRPRLAAFADGETYWIPAGAIGETGSGVMFVRVGDAVYALPEDALTPTAAPPADARAPANLPEDASPEEALPVAALPADDWPDPAPPDLRTLTGASPTDCGPFPDPDPGSLALPAGPATTTTTTTVPATTTVPPTTTTLAPTLAGRWLIVVDVTEADRPCASEVAEPPYERTITVTVDGDTAEVVGLGDGDEPWKGTASGDRLVFAGDRAEDDGTTTASFELDYDAATGELAGIEVWGWSGQGLSCPNGRSVVTASRIP